MRAYLRAFSELAAVAVFVGGMLTVGLLIDETGRASVRTPVITADARP